MLDFKKGHMSSIQSQILNFLHSLTKLVGKSLLNCSPTSKSVITLAAVGIAYAHAATTWDWSGRGLASVRQDLQLQVMV
jgi:hypothetical protein